MVGKIRSRKADQSAKPTIATVHGQCMSMAISWANKKQLAKINVCTWLVFQYPVTYALLIYSLPTVAIHKCFEAKSFHR